MSTLHRFLVVSYVRRITAFFLSSPRHWFSINATNFFDKVLGKHVGNTILINHNHVRTMKSPIKNVMLVEKWNGRVDVFVKYLKGEILPYLEALHSIRGFVFTFVQHKPFGVMGQIIKANIKFQ
jgi:hypothetical protein